jgi:hypothetical protein
MGKFIRQGWSVLAVVVVVVLAGEARAATPYDQPGQRAADWLVASVNFPDGTWGNSAELYYVTTTEAALALEAWDRRTPEYAAALAWLEQHQPPNVDFKSRRVMALHATGDSMAGDISYLYSAFYANAVAPGNGGFGLSTVYQGSPLDTALALEAIQLAVTSNVSDPVAYLKAAQLSGTDPGWAVGQETVSDPVTTAHVLLALIAQRATDSSLITPIANGLAALNAKVNTSSPTLQEALSALANRRNNATSSQATTLLNNLVSTQGTDGSWGEDVYATAVCLRVLAEAAGRAGASSQLPVSIPDLALRTAINTALGRGALDALNRGELAQLTTLNLAGLGISSLTGLEYATNLTSLDARNNNITSFAPVDGLTATVLKDGNPSAPSAPPAHSAPIPPWAAAALALGLLAITHRQLPAPRRSQP